MSPALEADLRYLRTSRSRTPKTQLPAAQAVDGAPSAPPAFGAPSSPSPPPPAVLLIPLALLDAEDAAIIVLSPQGGLLYANQTGTELLNTGALLRAEAGVVLATPVWSSAYDAALSQAQSGVTVELGIAAGENAWSAKLSPLETSFARLSVLRICDRAGGRRSAVARFAAAHGLSPRETEVMQALSQGHTLADYAARERLAISTVRTQLALIFKKTGARRQHELIARAYEG